jgi:phosphate transport system substrate-binding protein
LKQKLVSLLFALAFARYAPAQGATSVDLVGVGGTFALPIYTKWFAEYGTSNGGVQVHYLPRGSAEGISNVSSGSCDFGGSEVPMNDEELAKAPTKLLLLPSVVGGVVPIYNLPGIRQELRFTSEVLCCAPEFLAVDVDRWTRICRRFGLRQGYPRNSVERNWPSSEDCDPD